MNVRAGKSGKKRNKAVTGIRIITGTVIIIAGVIIAALPWIKAAYFERLQSRLIAEWYAAVSNNPNWEPEFSAVEEYNELGFGDWTEDTNAVFDVDYVFSRMEGILRIEKINFCSAVIRGVTKRNLDIAVCATESSPKMGQTGNYCVAGHYSRIYGRHFNRLREVISGDIITVENGIEIYKYRVYENFSVTPADTWVMGDEEGRKLITLITCDYNMEPMGRIIIKGELIEEE